MFLQEHKQTGLKTAGKWIYIVYIIITFDENKVLFALKNDVGLPDLPEFLYTTFPQVLGTGLIIVAAIIDERCHTHTGIGTKGVKGKLSSDQNFKNHTAAN